MVIAAIITDQHIFAFLFLIFTIIGLWEFYSMVERAGVFPNKSGGILAGIVLFSTNALIAVDILALEHLLINFVFIFLIFLFELYRNNPNPFTNIAFTFFGLLYVAVPFSLLNYFPNPAFLPGVYHSSLLLGFLLFDMDQRYRSICCGNGFRKVPAV